MIISISDISETKSFIILCIIGILLLSYLFICLDGIVYNKLHGKSILGRKYRISSFALCTVLSIVCAVLSILYLGFGTSNIVAAANGSLIGICIVDIVLVGLHLFRDYKEEDNHWIKGCPFEKRRSDG